MLVGIIDMDLFINKKTFLPNPEVMLYSAYHKKNRDIAHLLLNGQNIDIYEKIYIFRTKVGKVKFPEELYSRKNVICRGSYFTNGIVAPIPEEVFACEPDKSIYDKYCKYWEGGKLINGVVTFKNCNLGDTLKNIDINSIILETDSPYLTPVPFRGTQNNPGKMINTAKFVADIYGVSLEELAKITNQNIKRIFDI